MIKTGDVWAWLLTGVMLAFAIGMLVGGALKEEAIDDNACDVNEVRAEFTYESAPGKQHEMTRCVSLEDYQKLERAGRLVPQETP